jgi:hypothetical protein
MCRGLECHNCPVEEACDKISEYYICSNRDWAIALAKYLIEEVDTFKDVCQKKHPLEPLTAACMRTLYEDLVRVCSSREGRKDEH